MLISFWLLLFLYIGLTLLFFATKPRTTKITPWPILSIAPKKEFVNSTCKTNADCPSTHICMSKQCIPKLVRANDCNPATGKWISYNYQGANFAICACLKPHLVNQKYFGGNCDVDVGCGIHGQYIRNKNTCSCDPGYKAVGLTCQKLPAIDYINLNSCNSDEIKVSEIKTSDGFHNDYIKKLSSLKCVKRPCSFDAFSGRHLKHGKFVKDWGCTCDPRYGLFGVVLDGTNKKYLNTPGFDACASIFSEDPQDPIEVKLITYFYLGNREPISFIVFPKVDEDDLVTPLKGSTKLILSQQPWKYDYAQFFFNTNSTFRARTRKVQSYYIFNIEKTYEWLYVNDFSPAKCNEIPDLWLNRLNPRVDVYSLLYSSPVCKVSPNDPKADPMFWDKVIVNPQHITFKKFQHLHRFNSFMLHYVSEVGSRRWTLDLNHEYKPDTYLSIDTNAPNYDVAMEDVPDISDYI